MNMCICRVETHLTDITISTSHVITRLVDITISTSNDINRLADILHVSGQSRGTIIRPKLSRWQKYAIVG